MSKILLEVWFNEVLRKMEKCECPIRFTLLESEFYEVERMLILHDMEEEKRKGVQHK